MEEELISKKDLLKLTGISYGQLYRWKRKKLVPEDWFIRKSTFTGQETFFPKERILERIDKIINMKAGLSLDELAQMFTDGPSDITLTREQLIERNIVSITAIDLYEEQTGRTEIFLYEAILSVYILDEALRSGEISLMEGRQILQTLNDYFLRTQHQQMTLFVIRKMGVTFVLLLTAQDDEVFLEKSAKIAIQIKVEKIQEKLKDKLLIGG
ncbi:YhbD family protein [Alkalihalobacterium chitinilyticum]|uniref:YhbD family protein n=1 Tax=Alkalihalobacterium chitinilyticum TaxID=2980103 RepID=A0ABT5VDY4_9BACI|nr:YhbD family protein [Alkalihalobacterium chitinilyticum]MDE5413537.1 YhbD family protein [Alkalihalobacterium chitinilyticum]